MTACPNAGCRMTLLAAAASAASGLVAAAHWVSHRVRSLSVSPTAWTCLACGVPNELEREACWSCGERYGQAPLFPSHIPFERRWLCPTCAVWNGIARTDCWRCGTFRDGLVSQRASGDPGLPPGSLSPGALDASTPRAARQSRAGAASRRRNS